MVPPTRHTLGPRDAVRRYLGLVSPVCCGCDVRVEPRSGPLGQDGIDYFFLLSHLTVLFIGPCVYLKVHHAHGASLVRAGEGLYGGGTRTWPSWWQLRTVGQGDACVPVVVVPFWLHLLFFVAVIPQMGQLTFQVSSSSARSR